MVEYGDILEEYGCHISVASDTHGVCFWAMGRELHKEEANNIAKLQAAHTKNTNVWYVQRWLSRWFNWKSDRTASTQSVEDMRAAGVHLPLCGATLTLKGPPRCSSRALQRRCTRDSSLARRGSSTDFF
jgi:hypothetical protein